MRKQRRAHRVAPRLRPNYRRLWLSLSIGIGLVVSATTWFFWPVGRVLYQGKLTIAADESWTAKERQKLRTIIQSSYPLLVRLYGEPSESRRLIIRKRVGTWSDVVLQVSGRPGNYRVSILPIITCTNEIFDFPTVLIHELAHVFHASHVVSAIGEPIMRPAGRIDIPVHGAIEEAMAQTAAVVVGEQLGYQKDRNQVLRITPDCNKPAFAFNGDLRVSSDPSLYPIRILLATWTIRTWEEQHPGFIKELNQRLYRLPLKQPLLEQQAVALGEAVSPGFHNWIASQSVFDLSARPGTFLFVVGDEGKIVVGLFQREPDGREHFLVGQTVHILIQSASSSQSMIVRIEGAPMYTLLSGSETDRYWVTADWGQLVDTFSFELSR